MDKALSHSGPAMFGNGPLRQVSFEKSNLILGLLETMRLNRLISIHCSFPRELFKNKAKAKVMHAFMRPDLHSRHVLCPSEGLSFKMGENTWMNWQR